MSSVDTVSPADFLSAEQKLLPEACKLRDDFTRVLGELETEAEENHLQSPVRRLSFYISSQMQTGKLDAHALEDLVRLLTMNAFFYRAQRLREYVGECSVIKNEKTLAKLFDRIADGGKASFEDFSKKVEREVFGIVITAHPTFTVSEELTRAMARLASCCGDDGSKLSQSELLDLAKLVANSRHGTPDPITLDDEQAFALMAIANIRSSVRRIYGVVFKVAQKLYPNDWHRLKPKLVTVASWVGYDLDGRADIRWSDTLKARMNVERLALEDYLASIDEIRAAGWSGASADGLQSALSDQLGLLTGDIERLSGDPENVGDVGAFSLALVRSAERRLVSTAGLVETISDEIEHNDNKGKHAPALAVLRAEMVNFGLALAHTHVRINATQLTNAIRHDIGPISSPEDPANRRRYLKDVSDLLDDVKPVTINFGSIMRERTSAKRIFMVVAKFLKYVDTDEPVRFLIAECNTAFTVLAALYFAKLFGVDDRIDISPLFETGVALEHGHEIIDDLLQNPHYVAYIKARGRLCVQTGFSDAGRYIGQIPASLAIERVRIKMAKRIKRSGITDVEVVIFDTHGESIGRGTHPKNFADRLDYVYPPEARVAFKDAGIRVKQEVSFQGGDGYVYFAAPELAFATVCRLLEHALKERPEQTGDVFYEDTDFSLDFFMSVKGFNERLLENPNYAQLLDLFGANMLYPTGSRMVKRQHDGGVRVDLEHPSQVRAIPHNAILQQLGYFSNSISGLGKAVARDFERFKDMYNNSDRVQRFMNMAAYARHLSNPDALHGYISLFDPAIWLRRSEIEHDPERAEQMQRLADILRHSERHEKLNRAYRIFLNDTLYLDQGLAAVRCDTMMPANAGACYPDLTLLHAVRVSLIQELFLIVANLPRFSDMAESSNDVIEEILHLDVEHALVVLKRAFPVSAPAVDPEAFGEEASYRTDLEQGYEREHRELFDPMEALYDTIRRISNAVAHISGAVG